MSQLYIECYSGISGDMTVAALLDLGADEKKLAEMISSLGLGCRVRHSKVKKCGIAARKFDVLTDDIPYGHTKADLDMRSSIIQELMPKNPDGATGNGRPKRDIDDINGIIDRSVLSPKAKDLAKKIFDILAEAESTVHGVAKNEVHFHEVGAVDSIVDVCSTAFCVDDLGVTRVICSPLYEGTGEVSCAHGSLPVPVPAVLEIIGKYNIPIKITDTQGEMITPTGAAIAAALAQSFGVKSGLTVKKIGIGAGDKDFGHANILRAYLTEEDKYTDHIIELKTNIDDCTGEQLQFCLERLLDAGVSDAYFLPIYMKKGRPAYELCVMCSEDMEKTACEIIFAHTTAIGLRRRRTKRIIMDRKKVKASTKYGDICIKYCSFGEIKKYYPEYESAKMAALEYGCTIQEVYDACKAAEFKQFSEGESN